MTDDHVLTRLLHWMTHRIPGVPAHDEQPAGHQGRARHLRATAGQRRSVDPGPSLNHRWNQSPAKPPRLMLAWQRRIAAFFGQERR